jgi:hypothetical protein
MYRENKSLVFVFKNKEAIQVERPQRFNDLNSARRDQLEDTSPMEGRDEKLPSKLEA